MTAVAAAATSEVRRNSSRLRMLLRCTSTAAMNWSRSTCSTHRVTLQFPPRGTASEPAAPLNASPGGAPGSAGAEEAAQATRGSRDRRGVVERVLGEDGQQRAGRLGQQGVVRARVGAGQDLESGGEAAAGVGVAPGIGVREQVG